MRGRPRPGQEPEIAWGMAGTPESKVQMLPALEGIDVVELGCGTAYFGAWLKRAGAARVVGVDVTPAQLETARRMNEETGLGLEFVVARSSPQTERVIVGPMVTNPGTRDWTVIASLFATLNEMFGNRTICGIGRGDSAVRVLGGRPTTLAELRECVHVIRELAQRPSRSTLRRPGRCSSPWAPDGRARGLGRRVRAEGAGADRRGRRRLHPAARRPRHRRVDDRGGPGGRRAGRPRPGGGQVLRRRAGVRRRRPRRTQREQTRWFGGMVGNHVADIVARYGADAARCRRR